MENPKPALATKSSYAHKLCVWKKCWRFISLTARFSTAEPVDVSTYLSAKAYAGKQKMLRNEPID
jgi:hypothetical protein